jgi:hypothetical protein
MEQQQPKDNSQDIEAIRRQVQESSIHISDAGKETKTRFKQFANTHFGGHYGHALSSLLDFREGLVNTPQGELWEAIDATNKRLIGVEATLSDLLNTANQKTEQTPGRKNLLGQPMR